MRRHYARWAPERQERLTNILKDAFEDKPKPKLVSLPGWARLGDIQQARMYAPRRGFGDAVHGVRFLATHSDFDDTGIVLDELAHGFPTQPPQAREIANAVVLFKSVVDQHGQ